MKEKPILFSTEMVQAILAGRKIMTRRTKGLEKFNINPSVFSFNGKTIQTCRFWDETKESDPNPLEIHYVLNSEDGFENKVKCPYGKPGDLLWVRETWGRRGKPFENTYRYKADKSKNIAEIQPWKPSIHMPKAAARIWLQVTNVRVERLQEITEDAAIAEGVVDFEDGTYANYFKRKGLRAEDGVECLLAKGSFQSLWDSINGPDSWELNPWVWVIEFEVLSTTGKEGIK